jgi:tetratricopeptide (TPR) repeat protein
MGLFVVWWERIRCGTRTLNLGLNFSERVLLASRALWFYAWKLLWPFDLSFSYTQWKIDWTEPLQYTWLLACVIALLFIWYLRNKLGRGVIAAIVFFVATLFPMLGFFSLYTFFFTYVADHYQYMACIGPISLAVAGSCLAAARFGRYGETIAKIAGVCILGLLGLLTYRQCRIYKNEELLWLDTLQKNPDSWIAHNNLARELGAQGKLDEAVGHCRKAVSLAPYRVEVLYNFALCLKSQGKLDEAMEYFRRAIKKMDKFGDPWLYTEVFTDFGSVLQKQGDLEEALACLTKASALKPDNFRAQLGLAAVYAQQGKKAEAFLHIEKALKIRPESAEVDSFRQFLLKQDQLNKTAQKYEQILKSRPNDPDAHNAIGEVFLWQGKYEESITHFSEAIRLKADWASPMNNLAFLLATHPDRDIRDVDKAVSLAEQAADLTNHENVEVLDTLAAAYASAGQFDKAVINAQKALDLSVASGKTKMSEEIKMRLNLYKQGKPYRIIIDNNKQ